MTRRIPHDSALAKALDATLAQLEADEPGAPNIDGWSVDSDDIWALARCLEIRQRTAARVMFPTRPRGYVSATLLLRRYACAKAAAMEHRARGDVTGALSYETQCEVFYDRLPEFARW